MTRLRPVARLAALGLVAALAACGADGPPLVPEHGPIVLYNKNNTSVTVTGEVKLGAEATL